MPQDDGEQKNIAERLIAWRVGAAMEPQPPNETLLKLQQPFVDLLEKYYFRVASTSAANACCTAPRTTC